MITKLSASATLRPLAGPRTSRIALALVAGLAVSVMTLAGATFATPAGATEIKMPSAKSRLLSDRDDVTIIIIDKNDNRRSRSTSPARVDTKSDVKQPNSRIRRDDDTVYIKRKSGSGHHGNPGPKVIIVDKNRGTSCSGTGVCVIRP
ncbi:MAG: hypothetical protein U1A06_06370 [Hoeflea sp.]|nr:hypothetical protein [Hoeflea sp.]